MSKSKRHHYLPQFYLEGFCVDGAFWIYDRKTKQYRKQTPINTAIQTHYYSFEDEEGIRRTDIESLLSQVEGPAKPIITKINAGENITIAEKKALSIFIAFLMIRVPDFEKSVNAVIKHLAERMTDLMYSDVERTQSILARHERNTGEKSKVTAEALVEFHQRGEYDNIIHRNASLEIMLSLSMSLANCFRQMDWEFLHAPERTSFITTDNPVVLVPPPNYDPNNFYGAIVGIITPGARKLVPLSQSTCLVMCDHGKLAVHHDITEQNTRVTNITIAQDTDRFLIGGNEVLVRSIVETTKLEQWEREGRFQIN